jgi:hypothetical protein
MGYNIDRWNHLMGACRMAGTTASQYARDLDIKLQSLKDIATGRTTSRRIQAAIGKDYPEVVQDHPWEQEVEPEAAHG